MNGLLLMMGYRSTNLLYIDPATTSYLIQIGAGLIIAIGTVLGIYRNKIKRFFRKNKEAEMPQIDEVDRADKKVITAEDLMKDDAE